MVQQSHQHRGAAINMNRFGLGTLNKFAEQAKQAGNKFAASASEASSRLPTFDQLSTYQTGSKAGRQSGAGLVRLLS